MTPSQVFAATDAPSVAPVAVVTGAARGIGLAIVDWFLEHGYRVVLLDVDATTLQQTNAALGRAGLGERCLAVRADVSVPEDVQQAFARAMSHFGRVDALVNNAGVAVFKPILHTTFAEWRRIMDVNLDGAFLCTQTAAPLMLQGGGGAVVNIASISGLRASTLRVAYGTSKGALIHLTKQQACELGDVGVRVNAVAPGPVETEMAKQVHDDTIRRDYFDAIPLKRYGTVQEIAAAVGFLCSKEAGFINGQVLAVDGGFDASGVGLAGLRRSRGSAA